MLNLKVTLTLNINILNLILAKIESFIGILFVKKIVTWNVNGLRSILKKGFEDYLLEYSPDILCLQEIKAKNKDVEELLTNIKNDYEVHLNSAVRPGYSGTAILVKKSKAFEKYKCNLGISLEKFDIEGRLISFEDENLVVLNGYFPNGQQDHGRVDYKLEFSYEVLKLARKKSKTKTVIITGDLNTAHTEIDLKNPKSNINTTGFLPIEREYIDELIANDFLDVFREKNKNLKDAYTWWTYRNNCREKNVGWRLDYFFLDKKSFTKVKKVKIQSNVLGSDHCPVYLEIDV